METKTDQSIEVLESVYKGSRMGIESISQLLDTITDDTMREHLKTQRREYQDICTRAEGQLHVRGEDPQKLSPMSKIMSEISVRMNTLIDKTPSHVAQMMMQGNEMGVIKATKVIKHNAGADHECLALARDLLHTEEANLESMKQFL